MIIKKFNKFILNENLKTYSVNDIFMYLSKLGLKEIIDYYHNYTPDKFYIHIRLKHKKLYKDLISKLENFYGWYLAYVDKMDYTEDKNVSFYKTYIEEYIEENKETDNNLSLGRLCFEPKYDIILNYNEIPDKIYHITNSKFYFKIMNKGLIPKHLDRISYHPDRIFFGVSKDTCIRLSQHPEFKLENPILLTIDTKGLKQKGINFYIDPNLRDGGIYVIDNVSPKYIIGMKKLKNND